MSVKIPTKHSCGGDIVSDCGAFTCLGCGKIWAKPIERAEFWAEFREDIFIDIREYPDGQVRERWGISGQALAALKTSRSQMYPGEPRNFDRLPAAAPVPEKKRPAAAPAPAADPPGEAGPFGLPAWSDSWPFAVQLKWLDLFAYFKINENGGG